MGIIYKAIENWIYVIGASIENNKHLNQCEFLLGQVNARNLIDYDPMNGNDASMIIHVNIIVPISKLRIKYPQQIISIESLVSQSSYGLEQNVKVHKVIELNASIMAPIVIHFAHQLSIKQIMQYIIKLPKELCQSPFRRISLVEKLKYKLLGGKYMKNVLKDHSDVQLQQKQLKSPQRNNSCQCSNCGRWHIKLSDKEQIIQNNYHVQKQRKQRLKKIFISSVNMIIQVNRFSQCGLEYFVSRLQRKMQRVKSLHKIENKQIQFIRSHYNIDISSVIADQTPKPAYHDQQKKKLIKKVNMKLINDRKVSVKYYQQNQHDQLSKYTVRSRSNKTINQYIQQRLCNANLPPIPQTARSYRSSENKFSQASPYSRSHLTSPLKCYTRSISINKKL